ncbi:MAG: PolyA polymerase [candidate division WS6 bacterium GW2011_GWF1_35_23]|uniref:PolyA polymerase n=1 Tax=candidate division WS6 bacterium GW2011_GWF1_35_23 TaxID=1619097 RepID=A0A0G0EL51_9BACT|nr:MAG: PolyA polymerase [candidate division WS6 bacterium GW2011_GWF1_35_23]
MLGKEGFECYIVGGAIRDLVMGKIPHDYDLATDALPDEMLNIFPKSVSIGAKFGTVMALVQDSKGETHEVEVTTFRSESNYVDGRWPTSVKFVEDIDQDLGRRDFTFNAMAINLSDVELDGVEVEKEVEIYDPFNGLGDIKNKLVRAVGTPLERFKEDGLRGFKACRLAAQLDFEIDSETFNAIKESIPVASQVSMERIRDEFMKMLLNSSKPSVGIELMRQTGLLNIFMPELLEGVDVEQKFYHSDDVYWHSLRTCDSAEDSVKLAALLHDIGKPRTDMGNGHFYGHDSVGADMSEAIMKRMKFPQSEIKKVLLLIKNHMFYYPYVTEEMSKEDAEKIELREWTDSAVRRFIQRVGIDNIDELFRLRMADAQSNAKTSFNPEEITILQKRISEVLHQDMALKITDLRVRGEDLVAIGVKEGPQLGSILRELLDMVIDEPMLNTKEKLLEKAKQLANI